jgi:cytochrome c
MVRLSSALAITLVAALAATASARAQNVDDGKKAFRQVCGACHATTAGKTYVGPSLFGVVGRKSGSLADYQFSDGMRAANLTWTDATLDRYVAEPRGVVPGTKMTYGGMKDAQKRGDLIAYLNSLK